MKVGLDGYLREKPDGPKKIWTTCKKRITLLVPDVLVGKKVFIRMEEAGIEDKGGNEEYETFGLQG